MAGNYNVSVNLRTTGAAQVAGEVRGVGESLAFVDRAGASLTGTLTRMISAVGVGLGLGKLVSEGMKFNETLESSKIGISGLLGTLVQYSDANGRVLKGMEAFNAASQDAGAIQEQLKQAALETTASYTEMLEGFQAGLAPMLKGKIALSDTVEVTQRLTQAAGALGIPMAQLGMEMRQFFEGDFARSRLLQGLNITSEEVKRLASQGKLLDLIRERTEAIAIAGVKAATSYKGLLSNLGDFTSQLLGGATSGLFETVKGLMVDLSSSMGETTKKGFQFSRELVDSLRAGGQTIAAGLSIIADTGKQVFGILTSELKSHGLKWSDVFRSIGFIVIEFFSTIQRGAAGLAYMFTHPLEAAKGVLVTFVGGVLAYLAELMDKLPSLAQGAFAKIGLTADGLRKAVVSITTNSDAAAGWQAFERQVGKINADADATKKKWVDSLMSIGDAAKKAGDGFGDFGRKTKDAGLSPEQRKMLEDFKSFKAGLEAKLDTAGLTGYAKAMADIEVKALGIQKSIDEWKLKAFKEGLGQLSPELAALEKHLGLAKEAWKAATAAEQLEKYQHAMTELDVMVDKSTAHRIEAETKASLVAAEKKTKEAVDAAATEEAKTAATKRGVEVRLAIEAEGARRLRLQEAGKKQDFSAFWDDIQERIRTGAITVQEGLAEQAANIERFGTTAARGVEAAWLRIRATAKSETQIAAGYVLDAFETVRRGLDDLLDPSKWKDFGGVFKGIADSMVKNFTRGITDILSAAAAGREELDENGRPKSAFARIGTFWNSMDQGQRVGTALGAGAGAAGLATGGAAAYWQGTIPWLNAGATVASMKGLGDMGGYIGALVAVAGLFVELYKAREELTSYVSNFNFNGKQVSLSGAQQNETAQGVADTLAGLQGQMVDIFRTTGQDGASKFAKALDDALVAYLKTFSYMARAGTGAELNDAMKRLLTGVIPRDALHVMFGSATVGSRDLPGISGAKEYGGFSPESPLGKMLIDLGFTMRKVNEIVKQIDVVDPKDFVAWLGSLVEITVRAKNIGKELAKSASTIYGEIAAEASKGPAETFVDQAQRLIDLSKTISYYTGDTQIAKQKELLGLYEQYVQAQRTAIAELFAAASKFASEIGRAMTSNANRLAGKDDGWLRADAWARVNETMRLRRVKFTGSIENPNNLDSEGPTDRRWWDWGDEGGMHIGDPGGGAATGGGGGASGGNGSSTGSGSGSTGGGDTTSTISYYKNLTAIGAAKTAEEINRLSQQAFADLQFIFDGVFGMLQQAKGLSTDFADLTKKLSMSNAAIWDSRNKNPFRVITENVADVAEKWTYAQRLSGQAQLDVLAQIRDEGVATFEAIAAQIDRIHTNQVDLDRSIDKQIHDMNFSMMGNQKDWNEVMRRVWANQEKLEKATDPTERAELQREIAKDQAIAAGINPEEQIDDIERRIREDQAALGTAQTPEEIKRLTDEIQQLTAQYFGMFDKDDPRRGEAKDWATGILKETQTAAKAAYAAMDATLAEQRDKLRLTIESIGPLLTKVTTDLRDELWHVQKAFERLNVEVNNAYLAMAKSITDPNSGLNAALGQTSALFTGLSAENGPVNAFEGAVNGAGSALDRFGAKLDAFFNGRSETAGGGGGAGSLNLTINGGSGVDQATANGVAAHAMRVINRNPQLLSTKRTGRGS